MCNFSPNNAGCSEPVIVEKDGIELKLHLPLKVKISPKMARWLREQLRKAEESTTWITLDRINTTVDD